MKGDGLLALLLTGVHDDRDGKRAGIGIDPPILDFTFFIKSPGGLAGDAKAGVIQGPEKSTAWTKDSSSCSGSGGKVFDVLQTKDGGGGVEGAEVLQGGCIADEKTATGTGVGTGFFNQCRGGIDASGASAFAGDGPREDTLSATEVEMGFVFEGMQESERAWDDDLLVKVGTFFADETVIPSGGFVPRGIGCWLARAGGARCWPGVGTLAARGRHERKRNVSFLPGLYRKSREVFEEGTWGLL